MNIVCNEIRLDFPAVCIYTEVKEGREQDMQTRKIDWTDVQRDPSRFLEIAQGISPKRPDLAQLKTQFERLDAFGFYDGSVLAGFALVDPNSFCLANCALIRKLQYSWEYNQEQTIAGLLCAVAAAYRDTKIEMLAMDIDKKHELNRQLYTRLGFRDSPMRGLNGKDSILILAAITDLLRDWSFSKADASKSK